MYGKKIKIAGRKIDKQGKKIVKNAEKIEKGAEEAQNKINSIGNLLSNLKMPNMGNFDKAQLIRKAIRDIFTKKIKLYLILGGSIILIIFIFIMSLVIDMKKDNERGKYIEGDGRNVPYVVSSQIMDKLVIAKDESGKYTYAFKDDNNEVISLDEALDDTIKKLRENKSESLKYLGSSDEQKRTTLKNLIQAEIATQYPDLADSEDLGLTSSEENVNNTDNQANVSFDVTTKENFITDIEKMREALSSYNDTMANYAQDFLDFQEKYGINAIFIAAVCIRETGGGTTGHAIDGCNNWGNIDSTSDPLAGGKYMASGNHNWAIYPDAKTGIEAIFYLIAERGPYVAEGNKTIAQIFVNYNREDANEPINVASDMAKMYAKIGNTEILKGGQSDTSTTTKTGQDKVDKDITSTVKGGIKVQKKDDKGNVTSLKYISTDDFNALLNSKDEKIFNYYTLVKTQSSVPSNESSNTSGVTLQGSEVSEQIWNFLVNDMGYSEYVAAGILGNVMAECGGQTLNIDIHLYDTTYYTHYGIFQWDTTYPSNYVVKDKELPEQLQHYKTWIKEFDTYASNYKDGFSYQEFLTMTDPGQCGIAFGTVMERFTSPYKNNKNATGYKQRADNSRNAYATYGGKNQSKSSNTKETSSNEDKSDSTTINNNSSESNRFDNFLFIGDSRYEGISSELQELGNNVTVCAVTGSNPEQWIETSSSGKGKVKSKDITLPNTASGVSVMLGVNNISMVSQMQQVLENLHNRYPSATIYANSVFHVGSAYTNMDKDKLNSSIDDFNNKIRDYCNQNAWAEYIDITNNLLDSSGYLKSEYQDSEGLHIKSEEGRKVLVNNIQNEISGNTNSNNSNITGSTSVSASRPTYSIIVANKTVTEETVTDEFEYQSSYGVETSNGRSYSTNRFSNQPSSETIKSSSETTYSKKEIAYQEALKNYTLYFDFLWAVLVQSNDYNLVNSWVELATKDIEKQNKIIITSYNEYQETSSSSTSDKGYKNIWSGEKENKTASCDVYAVKEKSVIVNKSWNQKLAVTYADTWLVKYENDASTYEEYKSKNKEKETTKIDPNSDDDNIVKILQKSNEKLKKLKSGKYRVDDMIKDNEKVQFMSDIYKYILDISLDSINGDVNSDNEKSLSKLLDASSFNLDTFKPATGVTGSTQLGDFNGSFLEIAKKCHAYVRENMFTYAGNSVPITENSKKTIDCSAYVSWVLYEYGYKDLGGGQLGCSGGTLVPWGNNNLQTVWSGFTHNVKEISNIQPGDICVFGYESQKGGATTKHTQIFAGYDSDGKAIWYNCGSTKAIQKNEGSEKYNTYQYDGQGFLYVYRVPIK